MIRSSRRNRSMNIRPSGRITSTRRAFADEACVFDAVGAEYNLW
jgi:hypothetical protein